jgi:tRNA pseudouridine38-40 synthase
VTGEDLEIVGASRTDGGAHALGQVCHFDTVAGLPPERWKRALNRVLPLDVRVRASDVAPIGFHSRFSAEDRHYVYRVAHRDEDPFVLRTAHFEPKGLDWDAMRIAAADLVGEHDFRAFTEELDRRIENTRRTLYEVRVEQAPSGEGIEIHVVGTAFLRGMMRRMAGALVEVGRGVRSPDTIARLLSDARGDLTWPVVLPARGLTLLEVRYSDPPRDHRTAS